MKNMMLSIFPSFIFDRKTMGFAFYIPVLIFAIALSLILFVERVGEGIYNNVIVIQGIFIPFSCWCLMYRLSEMFEEGAQETLIPYYSKYFLTDFIRYFIVNLLGTFTLYTTLVLKYGIQIISSLNMIHFVLLILFYMFLGTTIIILVKNIEISLTIILIYTVLEVVTLGEYMPWPHIFLFQVPFWDPFLSMKFTIISITIIILIITTLIFIKRADRK